MRLQRILKNEWFVFLFLVGTPVFFYFLNLQSISKIPLCFFHFLTGFDCPGCGITRGLSCWFQGKWLQAIRYNALVPLLFLAWAFYLYRSCLKIFKKSEVVLPSLFHKRTYSYYLFGILFWGQWILKVFKHTLGF